MTKIVSVMLHGIRENIKERANALSFIDYYQNLAPFVATHIYEDILY
ncbi:MAG: hypothetical protein RLZZ316_284 [Bacteroidota bacterium]|jgi:hypothetical protein